MTRLRSSFPQIGQDRWLEGRKEDGSYGVKWLTPAGQEMTEDDWNFPDSRFVSYVLAAPDQNGAPLFIIINGADADLEVTFPEWPGATHWRNVLDTAMGEPQKILGDTGSPWTVRQRSILAFAGEP